MNIIILDTETVSLEKRFCYNLGYVIVNTETGETLESKDFVIEQIWGNRELFETAYYENKKPLYIGKLRSRKAKLLKYGYACNSMIADIKRHNVEIGYAFNSPFDVSVFDFNCDWFKTRNPLDYIQMFDIQKMLNLIVESPEYNAFCCENGFVTPTNRIKTTAESVTAFLRNDPTYQEEHTALADSIIEAQILLELLKRGVDITVEKKQKQIQAEIERTLTVNHKGTVYEFEYNKMTTSADKLKITLK